MIAYGFSSSRKDINWRTVLWGFGLQIIFAILILKTLPGRWVFSKCNSIVIAILGSAQKGAEFIFGNLINSYVPVGQLDAAGNFTTVNNLVVNNGMAIFAFSVLPTIIFFSSLMGILYHYGIMQKIVSLVARARIWLSMIFIWVP